MSMSMGFFDRDPFDLNRDGKIDAFEEDIELQMIRRILRLTLTR